jgi:hypothetical protein
MYILSIDRRTKDGYIYDVINKFTSVMGLWRAKGRQIQTAVLHFTARKYAIGYMLLVV